jgi:hypothetical protein
MIPFGEVTNAEVQIETNYVEACNVMTLVTTKILIPLALYVAKTLF